uniref:Uncharacterized protein LOC105139355 n=1 Tax=Rhizophora mucronata TaxID=61149 RepID=A0A2P2NJI9_RHIMU
MDSGKPSDTTPKRNRLVRRITKVLHLGVASTCGIAPMEGAQKVKPQEKVNDGKNHHGEGMASEHPSLEIREDDEYQKGLLALESLLAKLFASTSSIKAAYAQLQFAQSPYDADGIQAADRLVISQLKNLSELKQCYVKKQFDSSPESSILSAEVQEMKSLCKIYEIMGKRLESQFRLKESEIIYLREKLEESHEQNRLLEKRFNRSEELKMPGNLHQSGSSFSHFNTVLRRAVKSIRGFVKLMINQMKSANWDLDAAAAAVSIESGVDYWRTDDDKCFAFESFVCRVMFDGFHLPNFSLTKEPLPKKRNDKQQDFLKEFAELKSVKAKEFLSQKPNSAFSKFCRVRYLQLVHPVMESSLFGNLSQRTLVDSGEFPETSFFDTFAQMAKRIWLVHRLAFSFEPEASIFQASRGCRFSEVYMECVVQDEPLSRENALVAFTVVPGFRIGKTVIQCQVYLSQVQSKQSR